VSTVVAFELTIRARGKSRSKSRMCAGRAAPLVDGLVGFATTQRLRGVRQARINRYCGRRVPYSSTMTTELLGVLRPSPPPTAGQVGRLQQQVVEIEPLLPVSAVALGAYTFATARPVIPGRGRDRLRRFHPVLRLLIRASATPLHERIVDVHAPSAPA